MNFQNVSNRATLASGIFINVGKRLLLECLKLNYITFKEDHRFQALGYLGPVTEKTT